MPLPEPIFDPRRYRDIVNEAMRRIPVHNPEWTNFNDSDPGVTVLQAFAFMTESLLYRANRIPERNRQKYLRLLGIEMRAPQSARGIVAFSNPNGALRTRTLQPGQILRAGPTPFQTENGLDVFPVEMGLFYKSRLTGQRRADAVSLYEQLYASFALSGSTLDYYETKVLEPPEAGSILPNVDVRQTVDGLWLALFARKNDDVEQVRQEIANKTLTIGILPALDSEGCMVPPDGERRQDSTTSLLFESPQVQAAGLAPQAAYTRLAASTTDNPLIEPSIIQVRLGSADSLRYWQSLDPLEAGTGAFPPSLEDDKRIGKLITWVRIRLPQETSAGGQVDFRVSWIGINAARVIQRARVSGEGLPRGTGEPDQTAVLANTPVIAESLQLTVNGEQWFRIDDLNAAGPEVDARSPRLAVDATGPSIRCQGGRAANSSSLAAGRTAPPMLVYTVDRESGEIRFGDGLHGTRPPLGATILASYEYGGGREGVVGIGAINKGTLPAEIKVTNAIPTYGGDSGETISEAEKRIPGFIRHRERLVSDSDFRELTLSTPGVDLGRAEVLSLFHPNQPLQSSPGVVTVMVVPAFDPLQPDAPQPDRLLLQTICEYLAPRRLITTELYVRGPNYIDVWVSLAIEVIPGRDDAPVREGVQNEVKTFLSALRGGFGGEGWPLNRPVDIGEISAAAARAPGVARIAQALLGTQAGVRALPLPISGLDLPRLVGIAVVSGTTAVPIEELTGTLSETQAPNANTTAVPVIPETC